MGVTLGTEVGVSVILCQLQTQLTRRAVFVVASVLEVLSCTTGSALRGGVNVVGADHPRDDVGGRRPCVYERWGEWSFKRGSERFVYTGRALCVDRTSRLGRRFIISVR